jgi:hypothetical protein
MNEIWLENKLMGAAVVDVLKDGLEGAHWDLPLFFDMEV